MEQLSPINGADCVYPWTGVPCAPNAQRIACTWLGWAGIWLEVGLYAIPYIMRGVLMPGLCYVKMNLIPTTKGQLVELGALHQIFGSNQT